MTGLAWWQGGLALGAIAVGHWVADRRPLGVSGVLGRFANLPAEWRAERETRRAARADAAGTGDAALAAALAAATAEALEGGDLRAGAAGAPAPRRRTLAPPPPLAAHAVFLAALAGGGLLARLAGRAADPLAGLAGRAGPGALAVLALGGLLAGFGSAWMGGCTAGHGLTGCARGMPGSLVATVVFLATAAAVSIALGGGRPW